MSILFRFHIYHFRCRFEYIWCVSVVLSFIGLSAVRSNNVLNMQKYMIGVVVFGLFPVFYCILHYMNDVIDYIQLEDDTDVEDTEIKVWQVTFNFFLWSKACIQNLMLLFSPRISHMDFYGTVLHLLLFRFTDSH